MRDAEERPCSRELRPRKPGGHGALLAELSCQGVHAGAGLPPTLPPSHPQQLRALSISLARRAHPSLQKVRRLLHSPPPPSIDSGAMLS